MSSITSLISGGGGGGSDSHIITDPKKLTRSAVARYRIKNTETTQVNSGTSTFFSALAVSDHTAVVSTTTSDTYATLLDITSSNGGYLHWIVSNSVVFGQSSTVKITVDGGTPVEITYQPTVLLVGDARMFLGGGVNTSEPPTTTGLTDYLAYWNSINAHGFSSNSNHGPATYDDPTNNVYGIGQYYGYIQSDFGVLTNLPYQKLEFTSTLKIEVKQSTYSTTSFANNAACFYTLF